MIEASSPGLNPGLDPRPASEFAATRRHDPLQAERSPTTWIVSESGLYTLILRSRAATTPGTFPHRFRRWVTREVLPAIRRDGRYASPGAAPEDVASLQLRRFITMIVEGRPHTYEQPPEFILRELDQADGRIIAHNLEIARLLYLKLEQRVAMALPIADDPAIAQLGQTIQAAADRAAWWLRPEAAGSTRH